MSIASELARIQSAKTDLASAIVEKGGTLPAGALLDAFAGAVRALPSGGGTDKEDEIVNKNISGSYTNARVSKVGSHAFIYCSKLTAVSFPACTTIENLAFGNCVLLTSIFFPECTVIGNYCFSNCYSLTAASFPACKTIGSYAFVRCSFLTSASFPACETIGESVFDTCGSLTTISFPMCTTIKANAFLRCYTLLSLYLGASSLCSLAASNAFNSTPIAGYTASTGGVYGSIFVPASLVSAYKTATNWTYFADRITAIPE